ncbi:MAG: hypothetical protein II049_05795 [Clostridia bacterium]|nr:hypothetical protein [Clostridia bacterium]
MNEQEAYKTVIQNRIVNDDQIKRTARTAAPQRVPALRVLKPIGIALAALLIVFGVTMAIPSARAEVFSWFSPASAQEYLAENPEDRDPVPELDAMITAKDLTRTEIKVNYIADEPYWREIGENFSATLGETIYDGNAIYISVDFDELSGYPLFENAWCPSLPADALLPTYLAEEIDPGQWSEPHSDLILTAENGTELPAWIEPISRPVDEAFRQAFLDRFGCFESFDAETAAAWRESGLEHCKTNGVRAVAAVFSEAANPQADLPIDENGYLTLGVRYSVWIKHSEDASEKLDVDLGTVTVNMTAYKEMKQRSIEAAQDTIALSGDAVWYDYRDQVRYAANLDGVTLRVIAPGTVDLMGIHGIELLTVMPDDWSEEQKETFLRGLLLDITVDDDLKIDFGGGIQRNGDGSYILSIELEGCIPFNRIGTMRQITLTPILMKDDLAAFPVDPIMLKVN